MRKLIVFGDSTTANYGEAAFPQQGWAYYLKEYVKKGIEVKNFGRGGASLRTFLYSPDYINGKSEINEPENSYWGTSIMPEVSEGDIVIFYWAGINDMLQSGYDGFRACQGGAFVRDWQNTSKESYIWIGDGLGTHEYFTVRSEVSEMKELLGKMIFQIREKRAYPIIVKGTGKYYKVHGQDNNVVAVNREYAEAVMDVAKKHSVEHYDIGAYLDHEFIQYGYEKTMEKFFLPISVVQKAREERKIETAVPSVDDNVHYNWCGAQLICQQLIKRIKENNSLVREILQ